MVSQVHELLGILGNKIRCTGSRCARHSHLWLQESTPRIYLIFSPNSDYGTHIIDSLAPVFSKTFHKHELLHHNHKEIFGPPDTYRAKTYLYAYTMKEIHIYNVSESTVAISKLQPGSTYQLVHTYMYVHGTEVVLLCMHHLQLLSSHQADCIQTRFGVQMDLSLLPMACQMASYQSVHVLYILILHSVSVACSQMATSKLLPQITLLHYNNEPQCKMQCTIPLLGLWLLTADQIQFHISAINIHTCINMYSIRY